MKARDLSVPVWQLPRQVRLSVGAGLLMLDKCLTVQLP